MKIGIITYHAAHNYGAMLQAYALQQALKLECGYESKIINYRPTLGDNSERILPKISFPPKLKELFHFLIKLKNYSLLKQKHESFELFLEKKLIKTDIYKSYNELVKNVQNFDVYITGSDQTFSPQSSYLDAFYLAFCPECKKVAYAPSFGFNYIPDNKVEKIKGLLNKYQFLSAREIGGCDLIESLIGAKIPSVLDPVFLLNPNSWRSITLPVNVNFTQYILCYALIGTKKQMEQANKIKKNTNLKIVLVTHSLYPKTDADITIHSAGPQEFLWLFDNASYVVTDSFHGTAFAIILKKQFSSLIVFKEKSSRIINLLKLLNLESRLVNTNIEFTKDMINIDYEKVSIKLEKEKTKSLNYLKGALNE